MSNLHDQIAAAEAKVFGKNPVRGADGAPLERGHGSEFAKAPAEDKAHLAALLDVKKAQDAVDAAQGALASAQAKLAVAAAKIEEKIAPPALTGAPTPAAPESEPEAAA